MTHNQIDYWKLKETERSNRANEYETNRSNLEKERQGRTQLAETNRHNLVAEAQTWSDLGERSRHNQVSEQQNWASISENRRHNIASESLGWGNLNESNRHNVATEDETRRHNQEYESYDEYQKTYLGRFDTIGKFFKNVMDGVTGFTKAGTALFN